MLAPRAMSAADDVPLQRGPLTSAGGTPEVPVGDDELMRSFRDGNVAALEVLFDRHAPRIRAFAHRMCGSDALARDVTQATFLSVVRGRDRFLAQSRFVPWIYTIATNVVRDHRRRARREILTSDGSVPELGGPMVEPDPGLEVRVKQALQRLTEDQRQAVVLHQLEGLSFKEVAAIVGISETAVKVRAHRGYAKLRTLLGDAWEIGE